MKLNGVHELLEFPNLGFFISKKNLNLNFFQVIEVLGID
jgi:hypothetical protein